MMFFMLKRPTVERIKNFSLSGAWIKSALEFVPGFEQNGGLVQATDERWLGVKGGPSA